jgi:hypothetical protein
LTGYEQYFIERGLDTLREGGIMAFVVSSAFLDGKKSKIREKIAGKGKLLEARRLPNGVFNTTGVGTDIVIIRKEKGDPKDFSNGAYFKENSARILGEVTRRTNQFGKLENYVSLPQGETFENALGRVRADAVAVTAVGEPTPTEAAREKIELRESGAEAHKNRSDAMRGNDNAKKDGVPPPEISRPTRWPSSMPGTTNT